jgi:hypothetical protein
LKLTCIIEEMQLYQQNWDASTNQEVYENKDDQDDDGETKTILRFVRTDLNVLTLNMIMLLTMMMVQENYMQLNYSRS